MKIETATIICVLSIFARASAFAQVPATEQNYTNVTLTLTVATNVISTNSYFWMKAVITNSSSKDIAKTDRDLTQVSLTAPSENIYNFSLTRADFENMISHKSSDGILADSIYKWPLALKLNEENDIKKIVPGPYILQAKCSYFASSYLTNGWTTRYLTSNPVNVKIE